MQIRGDARLKTTNLNEDKYTTNEDLSDPEFQTKQDQFLSGQHISRRNLSHAFKLSWRMFLDKWSLYT